MRIISAENHNLKCGALVNVRESALTPGKILVTVFHDGIEVTAEDDTRDGAVAQVVDHLRDLALDLGMFRQLGFREAR